MLLYLTIISFFLACFVQEKQALVHHMPRYGKAKLERTIRECQSPGLFQTVPKEAHGRVFKFQCGKPSDKVPLKLALLRHYWPFRTDQQANINTGRPPLTVFLLRRKERGDLFLLIKELKNGQAQSTRRFLKEYGFEIQDYVRTEASFQGIIAVSINSSVCQCFRLRDTDIIHARGRRSTQEDGGCVDHAEKSIVVVDLNVAYNATTPQSRSTVAGNMAAYAGVPSSRIVVEEHIGFTFGFFPARLADFGMGDSQMTVADNVMLSYIMSCGSISASDPRVTKLKSDASSGSLSRTLGQPVRRWFLLIKQNTIKTTTTQPPSTTTPSGPQGPKVQGPVNMTLSNTTYRIEFVVAANTFVDKEEGDLTNLRLFLYSASGTELPKSSWISLQAQTRTIRAISTSAVFANQPASGYEFRLSAIDSTGSEGQTKLYVRFSGPLSVPTYLRTIILTSATRVIATSFSDVDILFLLQPKMSAFFSISANDFFNSAFTVTRSSNAEISIRYEFSIRQLATAASCNITAIRDFRSKFSGAAAEEAFKEAMGPQFAVSSVAGERLQSSCSYLSTSKPGIGVSMGTLNIQEGKAFSIAVPSASFTVPSGSTMRLTLFLRFQNGTDVPTNYWVSLSSQFLDQGPVLRGLVTSNVASAFTTMTFKLVAQTPLLEESFQNVQMTLQKITTTVVSSVVMSQSTAISVSVTSFVSSFLSFMSSYMSVAQSSLLVLDLTFMGSTSISWTISSLASSPCKPVGIEAARNKLVQSDGSINETLRQGLVRSVSFNPSSVSIKLAGDCSRPTVMYRIPILQIPRYDSLVYSLPSNVFYDATYGNRLEITLLDINSNNLQQSSWIWYNSSSRTVSGFPFDSQKKIYHFVLRATNAKGFFVQQNITVSRNWTQPAYGFFYFIRFAYNLQLLPFSNVVSTFISKLKVYFQQPSASNVIIFRPTFYSNNEISLYYQNTSLASDKCDVIGNNFIRSRILDATGSARPNTNFVTSMQPQFQVKEARQDEVASCSLANRKSPYVNYANKTVSDFFEKPKLVSYGVLSVFKIPGNTFIDEEEGNTRGLSLTLMSYTGARLPSNSWVALNASTQSIIAFPTENAILQNISSYAQYRLVATDSDGKNATAVIRFQLSGPPPAGYYKVIMTLIVTRSSFETHVFQTLLLLERLTTIFGSHVKVHIRSYSVTKLTTTSSSVAVLVWSTSRNSQGICDKNEIGAIQSKLFVQGTNETKPAMRHALGTGFEVTGISKSLSGPCAVEPPVVTREIPELLVNFCGPFSYTVPDDVFRDNQDGNTRALNLTLLLSNAAVIPSDYWLRFDPVSQKIFAVLTSAQGLVTYPKEHRFILKATDSTNATVNTTVKVKISTSLPQYSHTFSIQAVNSLTSSDHVLYRFVSKIKSYFHSAHSNVQVVSASKGPGNKLAVTWANCSLRYSPCDVIGVKEVRKRMQLTPGTIRSDFANAMGPEFTQLSLTETDIGPCLGDKPPVLVKPFGPITVTTCGTYRAVLPADTFNDEVQGDTRNLNVHLTRNNYYWVEFDSTKQEFAIVVTREIANSFRGEVLTVTLTASDLFSHHVHQTVNIIIGESPKPAAYTVRMSYFIKTVPANGYFPSLYATVRENILKFFRETNMASSVELIHVSRSLSTGTELTAEWSSCSAQRDKCDVTQKNALASFLLTNGVVTPAFKSALLPNIEVTSVFVLWNTSCINQISVPIIQNPLPVIDIKYCGYKFFQIPANTFYDRIDGNTRNLSLSILNSANQLATENWFHLDHARQGIWIVLADDAFSTMTLPATFTYKLKAETKRGLSVSDQLRFRINQPRPNASFSTKLNFTWFGGSPSNRNEVIVNVMEKIAFYFGGNSNQLHATATSYSRSGSEQSMVARFANCTTSYKPCDKVALRLVQNRVLGNSGPTAAFRSALGTNVYVHNAQVDVNGPCARRNTPPYVRVQLTVISIQSCSSFTYTIPPSTFQDDEQAKLRLSITKVNGRPINEVHRWVDLNATTGVIYGIVTESVIANKPPAGYNLTIKASDDEMLFAESHLIVQIAESAPQKLYQFTLGLRPKQRQSSSLVNEIDSVRLLNSYFASRFANLIESSVVEDTLSYTYSICLLPPRCDESLALSYFSRILSTQNSVSAALVSHFSKHFTVTSGSVYRSPTCQPGVSPPVPLVPVWSITGSYCRGFRVQVPANMFSDKEDGGSRNLDITLYRRNKEPLLPSFWVQFNKTSQVVYGFPSRETTLAYTNSSPLNLVARDTSGLEASIKVVFSFVHSPAPKYIYKISYNTQSNLKAVDNVMLISSKIERLVNKRSSFSFGLIKHVSTLNRGYELEFANCSASHSGCNTETWTSVKNLLFTSGNLPTTAFRSAMEPFVIDQGTTVVTKQCSNEPPKARSNLHINVSMCHKLDFKIPGETFSDSEDGGTRNLRLSIAKAGNIAVGRENWMQFDEKQQLVYGYPRLPEVKMHGRNSTYWLYATDREGKTGMTSLGVKVIGSIPQTTLKLTIEGTTKMDSSKSLVDQEILLINKIGAYFNDYAISSISFSRNGNRVAFTWSFCRLRSDRCDCSMVVQIRKRLQNVQAFRQFMEPEITIQGNVKEEMLGVCSWRPQSELANDSKDLEVQPGQYFYRYHKGSVATNSSTYVLHQGVMVQEEVMWMKQEENKVCGLLSISDAIRRKQMQDKKVFFMVSARDICHNNMNELFNVSVKGYIPILSHRITVILNNHVLNNCTKLSSFIQKTSTYIRHPATEIYIYNYSTINSFNNVSKIVWGLRNITEQNCTNGTVTEIRRSVLLANGSANPMFVQHMEPEFEVLKVTDEEAGACIPPVLAPLLSSEIEFPWWIIILLAIIVLLLVLLWLLWVCMPRCCWGCCCFGSGCCDSCCSPGGKYASLEAPFDSGVLALPRKDKPESGFYSGAAQQPESIGDKDTLPILVSDDEMKMAPGQIFPEDSSSGFPEDASQVSDLPIEPEEEIQQEIMPMAQSAPMLFDALPAQDDQPSMPSSLPQSQSKLPPFYHPTRFRELPPMMDLPNENQNPQSKDPDLVEYAGPESTAQAGVVNGAFDDVLPDAGTQVNGMVFDSASDELRRLPQPDIQYSEPVTSSANVRNVTASHETATDDYITSQVRSLVSTEDHFQVDAFSGQEVDDFRFGRVNQLVEAAPNLRAVRKSRRASLDDDADITATRGQHPDKVRRHSLPYVSDAAPEGNYYRREVFYQPVDYDYPIARRASLSRRSLSEGRLNSHEARFGREMPRGWISNEVEFRDALVGGERFASSYAFDENGQQRGRNASAMQSYGGGMASSSRRASSHRSFVDSRDAAFTRPGFEETSQNQKMDSRHITRSSQISNRGLMLPRNDIGYDAPQYLASVGFGDSDSGISNFVMGNERQGSLKAGRRRSEGARRSGGRQSRSKSSSRKYRDDNALKLRKVYHSYSNDVFVGDSNV